MSTNRQIKAVIFDMGGVLLTYSALKMNFPKNAGILLNVSTTFKERFEKLECGEMSIEDVRPFLSRLKDEHEIDIEHMLKSFVFHANNDTDDCKNPIDKQMLKAVEKIKANGLKTSLLTNNFWIDSDHKHPTHPFDTSLFDVIVESCREGIRKPNPQIYQLTLDRLQLSAEETIFVDDLEINCTAANQLGIATVRVKSGDSLSAIRELEKMLDMSLID